jgi:hypothetical protein
VPERDRHPKKEVEEALQDLEDADWSVVQRSGHAWGLARCPHGCCQVSIWSTPRDPGNHARALRRAIERCGGGNDAEVSEDV